MVITNYDPFPHHTLAIPTTTGTLPTQNTLEQKKAVQPRPETGAIPKHRRKMTTRLPTRIPPEPEIQVMPKIQAGPSGSHLYSSRQDQMYEFLNF